MTDHDRKQERKNSHVHFGEIDIRTYTMTIGDHPDVSIGPPVALSWTYEEKGKQELEAYEKLRQGHRRNAHNMKLNYYQRIDVIKEDGVDEKEIKTVERQVFWDQSSRSFSRYLCYANIFVGGLRASAARQKTKRMLRKLKKESQTANNAQ